MFMFDFVPFTYLFSNKILLAKEADASTPHGSPGWIALLIKMVG
jgi:hypothetical protein